MARLLRVVLLQLALAAAGDFYSVLGVPRGASKKDISAAFRKLSLRWHPDKNIDAREEAERRMRELSEAYTVLSNADERRLYDAKTQGHLRQQGGQWQQRHAKTSAGQTHYYTYESYGGSGARTRAEPQFQRETPREEEYYYLREESAAKTQAEPQAGPRASSSASGQDYYYVNFD